MGDHEVLWCSSSQKHHLLITSLTDQISVKRKFNLKLLAISVNSPCSSHKFCIALFYRPPSSDVQIFSHLLESLSPSQFSTTAR